MHPSKTWSLLWPVVLSILIPLVVAWWVYPSHLPPGFGVFPPEHVSPTPGLNITYFLIIGALAVLVTALIVFPKWFGFKGAQPKPQPGKQPLPWWFWLGIVVTAFFWWLMWTGETVFGGLVYFAFTPLWWGFITVLDGLVYHRNNGRSMYSSRPGLLLFTASISVVGWLYFEYYDYFVLSNWYYPNGHMPELPHALIVALYLAAYTTVWPAIFQWFQLLSTFPKLTARYQHGPQIPLPATLLIWGGLALIAACAWLPYPLFWGIWIGPMMVITGTLTKLNIWTPFTALSQGNWSPGVVIALSSLFNGFFWEMWNYGSAHFGPDYPTNPNYWIYDIPYVNVIHIFSEMPLLGYYGYLPFGALTWVFFIWTGALFNKDTDIHLNGNRN